jgi:hypothetical protein
MTADASIASGLTPTRSQSTHSGTDDVVDDERICGDYPARLLNTATPEDIGRVRIVSRLGKRSPK